MNLEYGGERRAVVRGVINARILDTLEPVSEDTLERIQRAQRNGNTTLIVDAHLYGAPDESGVIPAWATWGQDRA